MGVVGRRRETAKGGEKGLEGRKGGREGGRKGIKMVGRRGGKEERGGVSVVGQRKE